jgi:hypothetical protein
MMNKKQLAFHSSFITHHSSFDLMRLFTVEEANAMLPTVREILGKIQRGFERVVDAHEAAQQAAERAPLGGGGMEGGARYVKTLTQLGEWVAGLEQMGVQIKDYERGLVDFPAMRDGRVVLLCWQLGEGESIEWWHDVEAGFAGRQPL